MTNRKLPLKILEQYRNKTISLEPDSKNDLQAITEMFYKMDYDSKRLDEERSELQSKNEKLDKVLFKYKFLTNEVFDLLEANGYLYDDCKADDHNAINRIIITALNKVFEDKNKER